MKQSLGLYKPSQEWSLFYSQSGKIPYTVKSPQVMHSPELYPDGAARAPVIADLNKMGALK